VPDCSSLVTT